MSDEKKIYKNLIKEEYQACSESALYFFKKYAYVQHPTRGKVLFNLYPFQKRVFQQLVDNDKNIILKSRQMGISTLTAAYSLWLMLFNSDLNIVVIATKQDVAKNLIGKVRYMFNNLPTWLKMQVKEDNKLNLTLINGSQVKATSAAADAGRSEAVSLLVVDEAAFIPNIETIWGGIYPTLSTGGKAILLSCVTSDTFIFTNKGLTTIDNFIDHTKIGGYEIEKYHILGVDKVRSGTLFHNNGKVKTYKIITKFSELEGSFNHKLWAYKSNENLYRWCELQELTTNDYVSTQYNMDIWGNNNILDLKVSKSKKIKNIVDDNMISNDLSYLLGLYLSEGNATAIYNKKGIIIGGSMTISCGDDISYIFDRMNLTYSHWDDIHYTVGSKNLIEILMHLGFKLNDRANTKVIPNSLLQTSKENIKFLLKGLFDGDGGSTHSAINYTSTSELLINQIRMLLNNFGILCSKFKYTKEQMNSYNENRKYNYDVYRLEIYGKYALRFYNLIGFELERKQNNKQILLESNFNRNTSLDTIPNSLKLVNKLYDLSKENTSTMKNKYGLFLNGIVNKKNEYKTNNISREIVLTMFNLFSHLLDDDEFEYWNKIINDRIVWTKIKNINESENYTYDFSLPNDDTDVWDHSVIYNGFIGHQTPNGMGNFFHKQWITSREQGFNRIRLHWSMHPDYDDKWRIDQEKVLGEKLATQECDGSFISSGDTLIPMRTLEYYAKNIVKDPIEKRGWGQHLWIWKNSEPGKNYMVCADVARGDSNDFSAFHIIDLEDLEQVAEFKGKIDTKSYGNMLVAIATEYNDALLVVENQSIGWASIQQVIEKRYHNLFYMEQDIKYVDANHQHRNKLRAVEKKKVPGFTTSPKTRPLIMNKLEEYFRDNDIIIYSERTIEELSTFIVIDGRTQAMSGYNDDLTLALAIGLWIRDTALRLLTKNIGIQKETLNNIVVSGPSDVYTNSKQNRDQQWIMEDDHGNKENLTDWL